VPVPPPPIPFPPFNTRVLLAGMPLVRLHDPAFRGDDANPCRGGPTRFAPIFRPDGACVPTLYAAGTFEAAVFETVFHDVPHTAATKFVPLGKVTSRTISRLELQSDLLLASLNEPDLNRLGLTRADLIDTYPSAYGETARWAEAIHRADPTVAGLMWTSRRCDPDQAFVFFGDRLPPTAFQVTERVDIATSAGDLAQIRHFGHRAGIILTI
jgi:hypothetical protein